MLKYFHFFAPNTKCALVGALSEKKKSTIQHGYRKCGTHARVPSQTLTHGNSKTEIGKETRKRYEERREYGKKESVKEKMTAYHFPIKIQ